MITLTDKAAEKVKFLQQQDSKEGFALRLRVVGGGCSGYSYSLDFDDQALEGDTAFEDRGVTIVIDPRSLGMIDGSQVDWIERMTGAGFTIQNPNAQGTCGCGQSFTV